MSTKPPPAPGKDLALWARQLHNYLIGESVVKQRVEPTSILLAHRKPNVNDSAATDGLLLFDPVAKVPVYSKDGVFVPIASGGGGDPADAIVFVGTAPPADPEQGLLWYSTAEPVGLFIWYVDADSSQWVQIGGGGGGSTEPRSDIPVGTVSYFAAPNAPPGWLVCNGREVGPEYPDLRQYLIDAGSPFGTLGSDPRRPELRGEFIRGFISGRSNVDDGRVFGSWQADEFKAHNHTFANGGVPGGGFPSLTNGNGSNTPLSTTGGTETRPRNVALLACIKAFAATVVEGQANFGIATQAEVRAGTRNDAALTPLNAQQLPMIGVGQTWQNVTRPVDTNHQNTAGRPIMVAVRGRSTDANQRAVDVSADGVTWVNIGALPASTMSLATISFVLPANHFWRCLGATNFYGVLELR